MLCTKFSFHEYVQNCIGLILTRNCLQNHVTGGEVEGRTEVTGRRRRRRRRKQLLDDLKETRAYWNWKRKH